MNDQKLHIRGSQSAFCDGPAVQCAYSTGCYRVQLIGSYGIKTPFPEEIAKVGAANENLYEKCLQEAGVKYEREVVVQQPIIDRVIFSGRMDFWCPDEEVKVRELKSATSTTTYREVIKKGHYKLENLAQTVAYMLCKEQTLGLLVYTYYTKDEATGEHTPQATRDFQVELTDDGDILVDKEACKFNVADQLRHRYNSATWLLDPDMPPRPLGHWDSWKSPCKFCDFKQACNMYDMSLIPRTRESFLETAEATKGSGK